MQPATMTRGAKAELKEKYVTGLFNFLRDELPKDEAVIEWTEKFKKEFREQVEASEEWKTMEPGRKLAIEKRMSEEKFDLSPMIKDISEQNLWRFVQINCMSLPTLGRMLQTDTETKPQIKLSHAAQCLEERIAFNAHMMFAFTQSGNATQSEAGMAMATLATGAKKIATEFPFEKMSDAVADKFVRYLKGIFKLVCPVS